jgi:predicted ArsR family transcriptional regulator
VIKITNKNIKKSIVELLSKKQLNLTQISAELQIPKENLTIYLTNLVKEGKIERITQKKPHVYKTTLNHDQYILNKLRDLIETGKLRVYNEDDLTNEDKKILEEF